MMKQIFSDPRLAWMQNPDIRPYVFVRPENRIENPGDFHSQVEWFPHQVVYKNPLNMDEVKFADRILRLESKAFGASNMAMPRWVFYDCAIVPGFVAGFAAKRSTLSEKSLKALEVDPNEEEEWVPLSLFIIIPTMSQKGEWVAHNLCSVNSLLEPSEQFYGIGFISKAFGLWYANVRTCCGMTQWTSPSVKLHANYGEFEVLTAFTPVHTYARTLTYRLTVIPEHWNRFLSKTYKLKNQQTLEYAGFDVNPEDEASLIKFQRRLEKGEGPYYLNSQETMSKNLTDPHRIYLHEKTL